MEGVRGGSGKVEGGPAGSISFRERETRRNGMKIKSKSATAINTLMHGVISGENLERETCASATAIARYNNYFIVLL